MAGIPLHEVDFVRRYWTDVFEQFVAECARGLTPNPDLPCNRHIKFDALLHHALAQGADHLATGHYARLDKNAAGGAPRLLRGSDRSKDQSYFLAQVVRSSCVRHCTQSQSKGGFRIRVSKLLLPTASPMFVAELQFCPKDDDLLVVPALAAHLRHC